tara:strand:- start:2117 stop:3298 length:1182 start_codon:yes stop_codon:yes gene_type:complete
MGTYKRLPLSITRGKGCWVWDSRGRKYLDAVSGIASCCLGHSNKNLRRELIKQLGRIQHVSNLYHIQEQEELASWLIKNSCGDKVFFCNSGAEANEAAIKLARKYGHQKLGIDLPLILTAKNSFHGRTLATISATGQENYHRGFEPMVEGFHFFTYNNLNSIEKLIEELNSKNKNISAILIEPIQGEGGLRSGDKLFFKSLKDLCEKNSILLIFDEVQTGMGRTGKLWCYEHLDIEPDAFTTAKGLGGGHAIGALITKEHANIFSPGDHGSTFGGNPFACKAGLTVAKEIDKRNLVQNAIERGEELRNGLTIIMNNFPNYIKEIRGKGLLQGILLQDEINFNSVEIINEALKENLLIIGAGKNVIRIIPPLIITKREINYIIKKLLIIFKRIG